MDCIKKDWYCIQCSLQFDSKDIFGLHKRLVHEQQILTKHFINEQKAKKAIQSKDKTLSKSTYRNSFSRKNTETSLHHVLYTQIHIQTHKMINYD